jgi:hypothetical protein
MEGKYMYQGSSGNAAFTSFILHGKALPVSNAMTTAMNISWHFSARAAAFDC